MTSSDLASVIMTAIACVTVIVVAALVYKAHINSYKDDDE